MPEMLGIFDVTFATPISIFRSLTITLFFGSQFVLSQTGMPTRDTLEGHQDKPAETSPCVQPAPLYSAANYEGPLKKIVVYFARKPEIKTVHPHLRPGLTVCALDASEKFHLFTQDSIEPVTFIGAAFDSGVAQTEDNDPSFGQGAAGYAKRYGAALADSVSGNFFHTYLFPVVFREDPRYYRKLEGNASARLSHALSHVFVAESDSGRKMFNFSEWLGTTSSVVLSNTYHPGNSRGIGQASQRIGVSIAWDAGFDALREFWPEIVRRLKLPFRERVHPLIPANYSSSGSGNDIGVLRFRNGDLDEIPTSSSNLHPRDKVTP
jgi:hypothetical protein